MVSITFFWCRRGGLPYTRFQRPCSSRRKPRAGTAQTDISRSQFLYGKQRRGAKFGDIRQHRHFDGSSELFIHRQFGDRFRKNHVGPGFNAAQARSSADSAFHGERIGARHDHEILVGTGIDRSLDPVDHFLLGDDFLVRTVAAALGADLVFDGWLPRQT